MRVAFYAPLKSPNHPSPSGDRRIARLFVEALEMAGWEVELASELRAWEGRGEARGQADIEARGRAEAERLIAHYRRRGVAKPDCWFTYHLYHKAPDWIGPAVSAALGIPYVLAEASLADKQRDGRWRRGHGSAEEAVRHARLIFNLNANDLAGLQPHLHSAARMVSLKPFLSTPPPATESKHHLRRDLARQRRLDPDQYWLLCVAMMRADAKLESYRVLADATARLARRDWQLLVAGDGPAAPVVADLFDSSPPGRVHFFGRLDTDFIYPLMRAADLFIWPARNEALGMAALEALACGLPVVAGVDRDIGGIGGIVEHGVTGILTPDPDGAALADEIENLLAAPATLAQMSEASTAAFQREHRIEHAAEIIGAEMAAVVGG